MEVVNPRAHLLSNFEVLALLRELEQEQLAETRAALALQKEKETALQQQNGNSNSNSRNDDPEFSTFVSHQPPIPEVCENLRTVEFEAIAHLTAPFQPTPRQSASGITSLTRSLRKYDLTKAEKLQIVNLAPTQAVELYVIVEELEDRLSNTMDEILDLVRNSLTDTPGDQNGAEEILPDVEYPEQSHMPRIEAEPEQYLDEEEEELMARDDDDDGFVDDGGGFEGDLEAGDDAD